MFVRANWSNEVGSGLEHRLQSCLHIKCPHRRREYTRIRSLRGNPELMLISWTDILPEDATKIESRAGDRYINLGQAAPGTSIC
jgi:hypothetical protein